MGSRHIHSTSDSCQLYHATHWLWRQREPHSDVLARRGGSRHVKSSHFPNQTLAFRAIDEGHEVDEGETGDRSAEFSVYQ